MRRFTFSSLVVVAVMISSGVLIHPARAFTLINFSGFYFDPISVPRGQSLHVHLVNQLGTGPLGFRITAKPTLAGGGNTITSNVITLNPGDGIDVENFYATFGSTANRIPVIVSVLVLPPSGGTVPPDFSARIASSVETVDPATDIPTAILAERHVVTATIGPCIFCQ